MTRPTLHLPVRDLLGRDRQYHPYRAKAYTLMHQARTADAETRDFLVGLAKVYVKRAREAKHSAAYDKAVEQHHIEAKRGAPRLEMWA